MAIWKFAQALGKHWLALMGCAIFTCIGIYAAWRGKTNHWVFVVSVVCSVMMFLVAALLAWTDEHKKFEEEIAKRVRPDVIVLCDWPSLGTRPSLLSGRSLIVRVLSDVPAINVKIQDIAFDDSRVAVFENIPLLERSTPQKANYRVMEKTGKSSGPADLESLIENTYAGNVVDLGKTEAPPIRIIARYKDSHGTSWQSVNELTYDFFLRKGHAEHVEIKKAD
jgi:hypothetical protein